jgi:hypothetical protein
VSLSTAAAQGLLALLLCNTTFGGVGDTTGLVGSSTAGSEYLATHTASPGIGGTQNTNASAYTGFSRIAVARSTGSWDASGTNPPQLANHAALSFNADTSGSETLTHFSLGVSSSGATQITWLGALTANLAISPGITASFGAAALVLTLL